MNARNPRPSISLEGYRRLIHHHPLALIIPSRSHFQVTIALQGLQTMTEPVVTIAIDAEVPSLDDAIHVFSDTLQNYALWAWIRKCSYPGWATATSLTLMEFLPATRVFIITTVPQFHLTELHR